MKKNFKKISVRVFGVLLAVATFASILPTNVFADPVNITLTLNIGENQDVVYQVNGTNIAGVAPASDANPTTSWIGFKKHNSNEDLTVTSINCNGTNTVCTVVVSVEAGDGIDVQVGGDSGFVFDGNTENIVQNSTITAVMRQPEQGPFDGKTYLFWSCGTGTCYHYFDNMPVVNSGEFINANEITDDNDHSKVFDVHAEYKAFSSKTRFEEYATQHNITNWSTVNTADLIGPDGVDYQPVNEPYSNNAYVSYADRNFKAIVYNDAYRGVTIGSLEGLTYYPSAWQNQLTRTDSIDISGTSAENPAEIDTVLLESKINIAPVDINGLNIASIEALGVPANAVTITKKNDGSFDFTFASRFYSHVVFKITDEGGNSYYLRINRQTIYTNFQMGLGDDRSFQGLVGDFYYANNTSYTNYKVTAKIVYKDGTFKIVEMTNANWIDDGLGNSKNIPENDEEHPARPEWPVGKGLNRATYKYAISEEEVKNSVEAIYINVEFKGSTSTNYAGALAGSGMGEQVSLPRFQ